VPALLGVTGVTAGLGACCARSHRGHRGHSRAGCEVQRRGVPIALYLKVCSGGSHKVHTVHAARVHRYMERAVVVRRGL